MKTVVLTLLPIVFVLAAVPAAGGLAEDLLAIEKMQWTAWAKADGAGVGKNITEDHMQVVAGVGAVAGRNAIISSVNGLECNVKSFEFKDAKLRQVAPTVAIITYTATQDTDCEGTKLPAKLLASGVYVQKDGKWLSVHYQETPID
jgi:uncharacterized protein (TIGR02246 family)